MKQKYIILIVTSSIIVALLIFFICFFSIPRVIYGYDSDTDSYYVEKVYGNARSYTIEDTIKDKPVTTIKSRVFMDKTGLESIQLGKNIKEIERMAFMNCTKLKEIDLSTVSYIGRNAFENCTSLTSISLTLDHINGGTFYGCIALETVILENTSSIGSYAFTNTAIQTITIPSTCMLVGNGAFDDCSYLKRIILYSYTLSLDPYLMGLDGVEFQMNF